MGSLPGRRLEVDPAPMLLNNAVTDAQPQTYALAERFGREERIEDLVANGRIDAVAVVDDVNLDGAGKCRGSHGHAAGRRTRIDRVRDQVEHDLVDLGRLAGDSRQRRQLQDEADLPLLGEAAGNRG